MKNSAKDNENVTISKDFFEALVFVKVCANSVISANAQEGWRTPDPSAKYALIENDRLDMLKKSLNDLENIIKADLDPK